MMSVLSGMIQPLFDRTLPSSLAETPVAENINLANLMFVVGLAIVVTVLAKYLSGPRNRKR